LLALAVGWHLILGGVFAEPAWQEWQRGVPWVVRGAVVQVFVFVPTLLLVLFGVGRRSRRELRLAWGDGEASAFPDPYTLWRRPAWRRLGPLWAVLISVGTLTAMLFAIHPEAGMLARLLPVLPVVLLLAATNTFNEEFQLRNVPLATLPALLGKAQALLLTAVYFGLEHFYGNPPAPLGGAAGDVSGLPSGKEHARNRGIALGMADPLVAGRHHLLLPRDGMEQLSSTSENALHAKFAEQPFCGVGRTGRLLVILPSRGDHLRGVGPQRAEGRDLRAVGTQQDQQVRVLPQPVAGRQVHFPSHATLDRARLGGDAAGSRRCAPGHLGRRSSRNNPSTHSSGE
jgi:hypothetical protein